SGHVHDNEAGVNASGASYNISIVQASNYITSVTGNADATGNYSETFQNLVAGSYTADVDVTYGELEASNSTAFDVRYNVTTAIPKSIYGIGEPVSINVSVFDTGTVPVIGADLNITITNSTNIIAILNTTDITDNSNGYYNATFTPEWSDDFNISTNAKNVTVTGDAAVVAFRATGFYVNTGTEQAVYKAGENVTIVGSLWDSLSSPRNADVTLKVFDPLGTEIENTTVYNQFDNYSYAFDLNPTTLSGTYLIEVTAFETESAGSLFAGNSSSFDVEYIVVASTNRSAYNTDDSVNVTINVKNGTTNYDGATVDVNVTYMGPSNWWDFDWEYNVGINVSNTYDRDRNYSYVVITGSDLVAAGVSLSSLPVNSLRIINSTNSEIVRIVDDQNNDTYLNTTDSIVFITNISANATMDFWLYYDYDYDITADPGYSVPPKLQLYMAEEFIITSDDYARVYYKHSNRDGTFGGYAQIDDNVNNDRGLAIADFDNDGDYDVVVGDSNGNLYLHRWTGVGTFTKTSISPAFPASSYTMDMATADFDEDGNMDFIVGGNHDDLYLYTGDGTGNFVQSTVTTNAPGTYGRGKDAGDVNEDGHMDFIYAENSGGHIYAFYGNGDGTFIAPVDLFDTGGSSNDPYGTALGDFNNDGHLDIISNGGGSG
ncbi:MAG: VCBS repeat-containing protein, partial [Methanosarcinales archaeon]|nr:VCBS repeat-containing protein [Methanosarcinales archaeon]